MKEKWTNDVAVEGYIYDLNDSKFNELSSNVTGEQSKNPGTPYISGVINIATDEEGLNIVPVRFGYVAETYKSGKPNQNFAFLKNLIDQNANGTLKTFKTHGVDAEKVRISGASVDVRPWPNRDGGVVANKEIAAQFINKLNSPISATPATFKVDMVLDGVVEHEEQQYLELKGFCFGYQAAPYKISLSVADESGIGYFESLEIPSVITLNGEIVSNVVANQKEETETAWGQARVETTTKTIRAWNVTGASAAEALDEDSGITEKEFGQVKTQWQGILDKTLADYEARQGNKGGFPAGEKAAPKKAAPKRATAKKAAPAPTAEDLDDFGF